MLLQLKKIPPRCQAASRSWTSHRARDFLGDHMKEVWKDAVGLEGFYQVSTRGRIRSVNRVVLRVSGQYAGRKWRYKGRVLKTHENKHGYITLLLRRDSQNYPVTLHILIAETFLPPRPTPLHQVNHKNLKKLDNRPENLEWVTAKENTDHWRKLKKVVYKHPRFINV